MNVADVMTQEVISIGPQSTVPDAARLMMKEGISGLPVIGDGGVLLGIVTEGDLLRRAELGTEKFRPHWLEFIVGPAMTAAEYVQAHARRVRDVMTRPVIIATEDMPLEKAVELMEKRRVKRLPVVREARVVGMLTRANLVRALAAASPASRVSPTSSDRAIREEISRELRKHSWNAREGNILVKDGVVDLWGTISSENQHQAIRVAAENVAGVKAVRDHLVVVDILIGIG